MFQIEWGLYNSKYKYVSSQTKQSYDQTGKRMLLSWEEHCLECAPPVCYSICTKYLQRQDNKCRNFKTGIQEVTGTKAHYSSALFVEFRDWAKLETKTSNLLITSRLDKKIDFLNRVIVKGIHFVNSVLPEKFNKNRKLNGAFYYLRDWIVGLKSQRNQIKSEIFGVIDLLEMDELKLRIETKNFADSLLLKKGRNEFKVDFTSFQNETLRMFPENNINAKIVIIDLGIREQKETERILKCVVWDLDNTIWHGTLVDGEVNLRQEVISCIKKLDERGVLNSIASKNDFELAKNKLVEFGIWDYFVAPKINWSPKSQNITNTINQLNIGRDSVMFIDDNPFERDEVGSELNLFGIFDENYMPNNISKIIEKIPITPEATYRRKSYQIEELRNIELKDFSNDFVSFLYNCHLKLNIRVPKTKTEVLRAKELISRTNQLNLSTKRYTDDEFDHMILSDDSYKFIFQVSDKFGDYGIVGFIRLSLKNNSLFIEDLVISCRVVQKLVEKSLIAFLIDEFFEKYKIELISANYIATAKNGPIFKTLSEIGFQLKENRFLLFPEDFDRKILPVEYDYTK
jgi:FkbH-like protein